MSGQGNAGLQDERSALLKKHSQKPSEVSSLASGTSTQAGGGGFGVRPRPWQRGSTHSSTDTYTVEREPITKIKTTAEQKANELIALTADPGIWQTMQREADDDFHDPTKGSNSHGVDLRGCLNISTLV